MEWIYGIFAAVAVPAIAGAVVGIMLRTFKDELSRTRRGGRAVSARPPR